MSDLRNGWPFVMGDRVCARGNWGPFCDPLRNHSEKNPGAVYEVVATGGDGRWLSLRDKDGRVYEGMTGPAFGHTYFRAAGECGTHVPTWRGGRHGSWSCARCDEPTPPRPPIGEGSK